MSRLRLAIEKIIFARNYNTRAAQGSDAVMEQSRWRFAGDVMARDITVQKGVRARVWPAGPALRGLEPSQPSHRPACSLATSCFRKFVESSSSKAFHMAWIVAQRGTHQLVPGGRLGRRKRLHRSIKVYAD